jgi:hypothetical protein
MLPTSIYCTRIDSRTRINLAQRLDPDIQNWRKGQKWTLRQKLAQRFAPIAPGGLDKNGYHANTKILGILCCTIQDLHYLLGVHGYYTSIKGKIAIGVHSTQSIHLPQRHDQLTGHSLWLRILNLIILFYVCQHTGGAVIMLSTCK